MFERYTESARRALFFARQETTELHGVSIETEHRLLGLLREDKGVSSTLFARAHVWYEPVRAKVPRGPGEKVPASVEIPLSAETERVLQHADEESSRLGHSYLGTEHVLLGLLREEQSLAGTILSGFGMGLEGVREQLLQALAAPATPSAVAIAISTGIYAWSGSRPSSRGWSRRSQAAAKRVSSSK